MNMYQCSKCRLLIEDDFEDKVFCSAGIDPRLLHRDKAGGQECLKAFEHIRSPHEEWHEKFSWE